MKTENNIHDCLIIGAGPIALALARTLELRGLSFYLCGELPRQRPNSPDLRTAALFDGSIRLLQRLGAWAHIEAAATPLDGIRIVDATGRLLRAPEQVFAAADIRQTHLGFNIPNPALVEALRQSLGATDAVTTSLTREINLTVQVRQISQAADHVVLTLGDGTQRRGRMAIGADGRASITRTAAGISINSW